MNDEPQLHTSIVSMVSLAAGIAAKHPDMGLCQLDRLRDMNVPEHQIQAVIEIARHIRDEASEKLDHAFDNKAGDVLPEPEVKDEPIKGLDISIESDTAVCCTPTASGQSCC